MLDIENKDFLQLLSDLANDHNRPVHKFYEESVEHAHDMGVHITGDDPRKLLDIKRPNEDPNARQYRLDAYKPKTKGSAGKAISVINRIYNERLFSIDYKPSGIDLIDEDNSLKEYLTEDYPYYTSLLSYMKSVFTKMHLKDANGALAVYPKDFFIPDTELFEPVAVFYESKTLVKFKDEEFYIILEKEEVDKYKDTPVTITVFDDVAIYIFIREKRSDNFALEFEYQHNFGIPPIFRVGGVVANPKKPILYESYIAGVLPHWDEAVGQFSDLQAAIVNHLYPDKWEYTVDCDNDLCVDGKIAIDNEPREKWSNCPSCQGTGKITTKGPYNVYQIKREALSPDAPLTIPPFGYGEKELESTQLLEEFAEKEIAKGFEAINMDILNKVGENQSGIAKTIDRQDLDSFLNVYASHIFNYILPNIIYFTILWRYSRLLGENPQEKISEIKPDIKAPSTFDVFSIQMLTQELADLKESGVNSKFLTAIEKEIIEKRFTDENTKAFYKTLIDIDPLSLLSEDEILSMGRVIKREDLYIHAYAKDLLEMAIDEDPEFLKRPLKEQKEKIRSLVPNESTPIDPENPLNG